MKKFFTLMVMALMAMSVNAKEEIPVSGFTSWGGCTIEENVIKMEAGWKGGAIYLNRDLTEFDYVWIKFTNATGKPNFGINYLEWIKKESWGDVYASTTAVMDGSGIVGIKLDKESIMVHGDAETGGNGIGDVYAKHVQQLTIQGGSDAAEVTVEGIFLGTTAEYAADGGDVPVRPEAGGSLKMWEGELVFAADWSTTTTVDAKYFDVAAVGDVIYCTVKDATDMNPIFKTMGWVDFTDIQSTIDKGETYFSGRIATEAALTELKQSGLRLQGVGMTLTKVELMVPELWTIAGSLNSWNPEDAANDMVTSNCKIFTLVQEDVTLEKGTNYEYKVVKDHAWTTAYPAQNASFTVDETAKYTITFTFNAETTELSVATEKTGEAEAVEHFYGVVGSLVGSWDVDVEMTKDDAGKYTATISDVNAGSYKFKVRLDKAWAVSYPSADVAVTVEADGSTVVVTFDPDSKEVTYVVTAPTGIETVKALQNNATRINMAGQQVGAGYKGLVIMNGRKYIVK